MAGRPWTMAERLCVFLDALALHHRRQLLAALR